MLLRALLKMAWCQNVAQVCRQEKLQRWNHTELHQRVHSKILANLGIYAKMHTKMYTIEKPIILLVIYPKINK